MLRCQKCGKIIKNKYNNCPYCGTSIDNKKENIKSNKMKYIIIFTFTCLMVILIFLNQLILHNKQTNNKSNIDTMSKTTTTIIPIPTKGLKLPDNLTKKEKETIKRFQGKWESNVEAYTFNGMKVQYIYTSSYYGNKSYTMDLKILYLKGDICLTGTNFGTIYCFKLSKSDFDKREYTLNIGTYKDMGIDFFDSSYNKISNVNDFKDNPKIGMTANEVKNSTWGLPEDINKTTMTYGEAEQWVYDDYKYIYFEDGTVTSIQE